LAADTSAARLRITEIFFSLQGEASSVGWPTVFVRLTGCPLRCNYCDTAYAFSGGEWMELPQILAEVGQYQARHVCVTGGEPLAQKNCIPLLKALCDAGYQVSLETSGALDIAAVDPRVNRVMDMKTPSSGEVEKNRYENLALLTDRDALKFVIGDRKDYDWACALCEEHQLWNRCEILFSPVYGQMDPAQLADWMLTDRISARFQLQLHKLLWGDRPGV
jgi:7-carboxy-7-deazaguanine synthase